LIYAQVLKVAGKIDDSKAIDAAFCALNGETFFSKCKFGDDGPDREGPVYPSEF